MQQLFRKERWQSVPWLLSNRCHMKGSSTPVKISYESEASCLDSATECPESVLQMRSTLKTYVPGELHTN